MIKYFLGQSDGIIIETHKHVFILVGNSCVAFFISPTCIALLFFEYILLPYFRMKRETLVGDLSRVFAHFSQQ